MTYSILRSLNHYLSTYLMEMKYAHKINTINEFLPISCFAFFNTQYFGYFGITELGKRTTTRPMKCLAENLEVIKLFFILNSAEHEFFSANKYENANNSWHFIFISRANFNAQLCLARKNLQSLVIWDLLAGQVSCSVELSMKKVL